MWPRWAVGLCVAVALPVVFAASASASGPAAGWEVTSRAYPTDLKPGGRGLIEIELYNTGAGSSNGSVTVTDTLPAGLEATQAGTLTPSGFYFPENEEIEEYEAEEESEEAAESQGKYGTDTEGLRVWSCSGAKVVTCTTAPGFKGVLRPIKPGFLVRLAIGVKVSPGAAGTAVNQVTAAGGGVAAEAVSSGPLAFGIDRTRFRDRGFRRMADECRRHPGHAGRVAPV